MGLTNVLIFEDDCVFYDGFKEKAKIYVNELKNMEWDLFYFGGLCIQKCTSITTNLFRVHGGLYGAHAYAVNHTYYDKILATNSYPIDVLYSNCNYPKIKVIVGSELLAIQDSSYSDLWGYYPTEREADMKRGWEKFVNKSYDVVSANSIKHF